MPIVELNSQLDEIYAGGCCAPSNLIMSDVDLTALLMEQLNQVWQDKGLPAGLITRSVTKAFAKKLWKGAESGYGSKIVGVDYDTPDYNMLASLQRDVWHFSAAKNYTQLRELSTALLDKDGKLRTYQQFKEAALKINEKHINQHLKAEYELAVAGGQMAGKWVDINADKDFLPLLEFEAVIDKQTTDLCRNLHGTILPVDHPFWNTYYPPNHFLCRSTVRQRSSGKETPSHNIPSADIPDMFKVNLGKSGLIYPKGHSYYTDLPADISKGATGAMRSELTRVATNRLSGKVVIVDKVGKVEFNGRGIKEMFNQPHNEIEQKNQYVTIADVLLSNASIIKSEPDMRGKNKMFHYLTVKGLPNNFILVVKESFTGKKVLYSIVDRIK